MAKKKANSLTKTVSKLKNMTPKSSIDAETVAKGAAGVAIAAGVVAAGAALSDEKTRKKLGKGAKEAMRKISEVTSQIQEEGKGYQTAHHKLSVRRKGQSKKS